MRRGGRGCWPWLGAASKGSRGGGAYGKIKVGRGAPDFIPYGPDSAAQAQRIAWMLAHRVTLADGFEVDHLCRDSLCMNPAHLEAVRRRVHARRSNDIGLTALGLQRVVWAKQRCAYELDCTESFRAQHGDRWFLHVSSTQIALWGSDVASVAHLLNPPVFRKWRVLPWVVSDEERAWMELRLMVHTGTPALNDPEVFK